MPDNPERIEVLAGIQRQRRYSVDEKLAVLTEAAQPGMAITYVLAVVVFVPTCYSCGDGA